MGNSWATRGQAPTTRWSGQRESAARWSHSWSGRRDSNPRPPPWQKEKVIRAVFSTCGDGRIPSLNRSFVYPMLPVDFGRYRVRDGTVTGPFRLNGRSPHLVHRGTKFQVSAEDVQNNSSAHPAGGPPRRLTDLVRTPSRARSYSRSAVLTLTEGSQKPQ